MERHSDRLNQFIDPAKAADDTVLALSSIERGREVAAELLEIGIKLCDYLIQLLRESKTPEVKEEEYACRGVRYVEIRALQQSKIDIDKEIDKTEQVREWINDLMKDPSSHTQEEITIIKEHLMTITMPIWRNRTVEFREREMKRGLVVHG